MVPCNTTPLKIIPTSCVAYAVVLSLLTSRQRDQFHLRELIKLISTVHATATTAAAFIALLFAEWPTDDNRKGNTERNLLKKSGCCLDDSQNRLIWGRSPFGNAITSFETGYLAYDTAALLYAARAAAPSQGLKAAVQRMLTTSPIFVAHHLALLTALGTLQVYISKGRERGVQVIVAFLLMNASNPLLHLRWLSHTRYGYKGRALDFTFAAVFAVSRFGVIYWVLRKYARFHKLSVYDAFQRQRAVCRYGTGTLVTVNAIWLLGICNQFARNPSSRERVTTKMDR